MSIPPRVSSASATARCHSSGSPTSICANRPSSSARPRPPSLSIDVANGDAGAGGVQPPGRGQADAGGGAGDEGDFALEPSRWWLPVVEFAHAADRSRRAPAPARDAYSARSCEQS